MRDVLIFGLIIGAIAIGAITLDIVFGTSSALVGFLVMFAAFSLLFLALERRRQSVGGRLSFLPGLGIGLGIAAVAAVTYALGWELYLYLTDYAFIESYAQAQLDAAASSGDAQQLEETRQAVADFQESYGSPLTRMPMTMLEILPVGVLVALVSAFVVSRRGR